MYYGAFKKYFNYRMHLCGCGIPYIILEGTAEDYKKILEKSGEIAKYRFRWYVDRIIPHIKKMVEAKEGKIDVDFFKNIIQKKEVTEQRYGPSGRDLLDVKVDYISGWILDFFAYYKDKTFTGKPLIFNKKEIEVKEFGKLAGQMMSVPFQVVDLVHKKEYSLKYKVGFVGCDQNEKKEVFPIQGWFVSPSTENEDIY